MAYKERTESDELKNFRSLDNRMILPSKEKQIYSNIEKGYEGEVKFDKYTEGLNSSKFLVLNDLQLETNSTSFQIDSFIISQGTHFPCELKNFEGDFYYKSDQFFAMNNTEIQNPLDQIKRSGTLMRQVLQKIKYSTSLKSNVFFVNPTFTLYQAPLEKQIIYPTQLAKFFEELNARTSTLTDDHFKLAEYLVKEHKPGSPYSRLPPYTYENLKKGITCRSCYSFSVKAGETKIVCNVCGCMENVEDGILRSIRELQLLFPNIKITTNLIFEWCKVIGSRKQIRRILKIHFNAFRRGKYTYYE
ncbi:nuclease-related domain-containing protein [Neobacillus sp. DY30]|uniref:nuclease-related domain-containing protein n=1 Tax=Neobacillus sp. DY30 TaxID=3047871 RepID=UPI0024BF1A24|nr:nuclease-related domain-containing protein [Neobacillus sp. DY30]WHX99038.1 nuclease-related domain-containing protein [Neobacillus sp. DY30]